MTFRSRVVACAVFACGLLLAAGPAAAECNIDDAIFEDQFEFLDRSWGDADQNFFVEDGALNIKEWSGRVNFQTLSKGGNVCVDMTIVEAPDVETSPIGLVFWWEDWDNFYWVLIWGNGWYEVRRVANGQESVLFSEESLALKKGPGETNQVELELNRRDATLYFNGTQVSRFKGKQPKDGGVVGFYALSGQETPALFTYDNLVVSPPAESEE